MRVISYGGGVQSTAMIVLAAQGKIPKPDAALFCNVGDDSEHPSSIAYVRDVMTPWAEAHGIPVHELHRVKRDGTTETLHGRLTKPGSRSLPIPVYFSSGSIGGRACTADFKIRVIGKWLKANGATKENPAEVCIGISLDEIHRASSKRVEDYEKPVYPLLDLRIDRSKCQTIIAEAGLPVPGKSSCYFCPFHRPTVWRDLHEERPDLFQKAVELENTLNERRRENGKTPVYLTRFGRPLNEAISTEEIPLIPLDDLGAHGCDSGHCFT
jgi:hypothetical protein